MLENIRLSFIGIWSHKMRSILTMLGIIIGIAAIIAIVSTIKGTNDRIKNQIIGSGNNAVVVQLYEGSYALEPQYAEIPEAFLPVTSEVLAEICAIPEVEQASAFLQRNVYEGVYHGNTALSNGFVMGTDEFYFQVYGYHPVRGRMFGGRDYDGTRKVAILDTTAAGVLFPGESALGRTIEMAGEPFVIIGIVEQDDAYVPDIENENDYYTYKYQSGRGRVFIPLRAWPIVYRFDEPEMIALKATSTENMTQAGKKTADLLNARAGISENDASATVQYKSPDLLQQAKNLQDLSAATNRQLIWIASISLLVGGIGVMNIMLVSVSERTREIGLKKALGARKSRIMGQFLTEAAVLTSLGGIIGVVLGIGLAQVVSRISEMPVAISVPAIILAVIFSMAVGIIFGFLPSVKAANLNPIDALRRE
ncbi:MAG: ABC transporter permease [Firmicutes bacterium]|nr:ABC transporter permease [Bacillota bacterium]